ncbi:MAG: FkbM family methyltransferase [Rhodobacterales bacterium]|nr:FkbM family methyltransferase [Rhodobacterales bacterium]
MTQDRLTSFTHSCEDVLLLRALSQVNVGFYIDVGAYDPVMESVTKVFYDRGWSGLNIEPNPVFLDRLQQDRPRDSNLGVAVSDHAGLADFNVVGDTGLSTLHPDQARQSAAGQFPVRTISVQTETLAALWATWVPAGQEVHFLKIDVEGAEHKVISGADWKRHRPWILVIEATLPRTTTASHAAWEPDVLAAGYLFAYFDGLNRYYVATEKAELLAAFDRPANPAVDNFKPFHAELVERNLQREIAAANETLLRLHRQLEDAGLTDYRLRRRLGQLEEGFRGPDARHPANATQTLWERLAFRSNGHPRSLTRRAFFHEDGKPRDEFRNLLLRTDGLLHKRFRTWMASTDYRQLPAAVPPGDPGSAGADSGVSPPGAGLTPRACDLLESLERRSQDAFNGVQ